MRFVIAGASGFLGSHLVEPAAGPRPRGRPPGPPRAHVTRRVPLGPVRRDRLDDAVIEAADVVVNLAGAPTLGNPHSKRSVPRQAASQPGHHHPVARRARSPSARTKPAFVAQQRESAGTATTATRWSTEESDSRGQSFMTGVVPGLAGGDRAGRPGRRPGLHPAHGARPRPAGRARCKQLIPLFKLGLGARLGDGTQYFPVISLRDWVGAAVHLGEHDVGDRAVQPVLPGAADQPGVHRRARPRPGPQGPAGRSRPGDPAGRRPAGARSPRVHRARACRPARRRVHVRATSTSARSSRRPCRKTLGDLVHQPRVAGFQRVRPCGCSPGRAAVAGSSRLRPRWPWPAGR